MTFTYNLSTDIGKVRRLIPDTDSADYMFSDEEIQASLDDYPNVRRAAADVLRIASRNYAKTLRITRLMNIHVDGVEAGKFLRKMADDLEKESDEEEDDDYGLTVIEWNTGGFSATQRLEAQRYRES